MGSHLAIVSLWAEDIPASIKFYGDVIGLRLLYQHKGRPYFDLGGSYLVINAGKPCPPECPDADVRFPIIAFQVSDLDEEIARLIDHGIDTPWGVEEDAGSRWVMFRDPGGNIIQFVQYRVI